MEGLSSAWFVGKSLKNSIVGSNTVSSINDSWDKFLFEDSGEKSRCLAANPENNDCLWDNKERLYGDKDRYQTMFSSASNSKEL